MDLCSTGSVSEFMRRETRHTEKRSCCEGKAERIWMRSSSGRSRSVRRRSVTAMAGSLRGEEGAWGGGDVFLGFAGEMFGKFIFEHSPRVSDAAKLLIRNLHVKAYRNSLHPSDFS